MSFNLSNIVLVHHVLCVCVCVRAHMCMCNTVHMLTAANYLLMPV